MPKWPWSEKRHGPAMAFCSARAGVESVLLQALAHEGLALVALFAGGIGIAALHAFLLTLFAVGQAGLHELLAFIALLARGFGVAGAHELLLGGFGFVAGSHAHAAGQGDNSQDHKFFHDGVIFEKTPTTGAQLLQHKRVTLPRSADRVL